jgi:selenide,water dikinase
VAKVGPCDLESILAKIPEETSPELLTSIREGEDAGVFMLDEDLALVQTVDFFTPIVDDPYLFGQIAAANALSDLYAMGARPLTALNIVAFPCSLGLEVLERILLGGQQKVREAGALIVGGHTIQDEEPKYGLAVTGTVKPSEMTRISGAAPGDCLVLTKPIGTGILATALKGGFITEKEMGEAIDSMCALNREAALIFSKHGISACTDVTGFALVGHLYEMIRASGVAAEIWAAEVPLFENALKMANMGMVPEGKKRIEDYVPKAQVSAGDVDAAVIDCLFDPQTSGGLLASVPASNVEDIVGDLRGGPCPRAAVIGTVTEEEPGRLRILSEKRN